MVAQFMVDPRVADAVSADETAAAILCASCAEQLAQFFIVHVQDNPLRAKDLADFSAALNDLWRLDGDSEAFERHLDLLAEFPEFYTDVDLVGGEESDSFAALCVVRYAVEYRVYKVPENPLLCADTTLNALDLIDESREDAVGLVDAAMERQRYVIERVQSPGGPTVEVLADLRQGDRMLSREWLACTPS